MVNGTIKSVSQWRGKMTSDLGYVREELEEIKDDIKSIHNKLDKMCLNCAVNDKRIMKVEGDLKTYEKVIAFFASISTLVGIPVLLDLIRKYFPV